MMTRLPTLKEDRSGTPPPDSMLPLQALESVEGNDDLTQKIQVLQAEVQKWRALEQARLDDDTDVSTIKSFLAMANDEIDRLR